MPAKPWSPPTRRILPIILIRGFGFLSVEDEKRIAYQGFNDGTVYPHKRGENYIYEGMILRFMKSGWRYQDATNVVGYYSSKVESFSPFREDGDADDVLARLPQNFFHGDRVVIDPAMARYLLRSKQDSSSTLWVFRYYDLSDRNFETYGQALVRLIDFIRTLAMKADLVQPPKVNIIAHSMGGLIVREAIQRTYPKQKRRADEYINKIVTLGTPHQGITFQLIQDWLGAIQAEKELERFNPEFQKKDLRDLKKHFPLERLLTVVGTNYRTYNVAPASWANRLFSVPGEYGLNYNRSDGLVKQTNAQVPDAPRTFVHKCHGGYDSLVTARESYEIATRFFFGNFKARLRLLSAEVTRGMDWFGKSEFYLGVSIKPRGVDFELFHQSAEAENCYGPFRTNDFSDPEIRFSWADANNGRKIIWEGYLNTLPFPGEDSIQKEDMVIRLDIYVGERDTLGVGFSDNKIFNTQYFLQTMLTADPADRQVYLYKDESFARSGPRVSKPAPLDKVEGGWFFEVNGDGFTGKFSYELEDVPLEG